MVIRMAILTVKKLEIPLVICLVKNLENTHSVSYKTSNSPLVHQWVEWTANLLVGW